MKGKRIRNYNANVRVADAGGYGAGRQGQKGVLKGGKKPYMR